MAGICLLAAIPARASTGASAVTGTVSIESTPAGVAITLDGKDAGRTPLEALSLPVGPHLVEVADPCWKKARVRADVRPGALKTLQLQLTPRLVPLKLTARLSDGSPTPATVMLEGRELGKVPGLVQVPACAQRLVVTAGDRQTTVAVPSAQEATALEVTLPPAGMVFVPGSSFQMGFTGIAEPVHAVRLDPYFVDRLEVTVDRYAACVRAGACTLPTQTLCEHSNWGVPGKEGHPVNCIDWAQAAAFCRWEGKRLPTEAEWELAARGTDGRLFPWGNEPADQKKAALVDDEGQQMQPDGHYRQNERNRVFVNPEDRGTDPADSHPDGASPFGVLNMAGNVWEWTADYFAPYAAGPAVNPTGPATGTKRVVRGGSWDSLAGAGLRSVDREWSNPAGHGGNLGVRCVRSASQRSE